jgi:SAM-dependent methyltransferase
MTADARLEDYFSQIADTRAFAHEAAKRLDLDHLRIVAHHADRSTLDIVANVLWSLCPAQARTVHPSLDQLVSSLPIIPQYDKLMRRWILDLADAGLLERREHGFDCASLASRPAPGADNPHFEGISTILLDVLRGRHHILEYVFGSLRPPWFAAYTAASYDADPVFAYQHSIVARLVAHLAARTTPDRPIRIVEIGAGMGGLTARLLPVLPAASHYLYTDVTRGFIDQAQARFADVTIDLRFALYDMNRSPAENGLSLGAFDAVVAFDVLHCARHLGRTLAWLRSLLRPGGLLINEQLTRNRPGHLIIPGVMPGFTDFEDERLAHCRTLLTPDEWRSKLAETGFADACLLPDDADLLNELGHGIIIARNPG